MKKVKLYSPTENLLLEWIIQSKHNKLARKTINQNWDYSRVFGNCTPNTAIGCNIRITYVNSFYFRGLNDADMEITVLDIQILKVLHREVKEVSNLIAEITAPYKALQQATKWLDQQEACQLLNISKRTLQTYRAKGILGATQINRKTYFRLSEVELLMQGERPLKKQKK